MTEKKVRAFTDEDLKLLKDTCAFSSDPHFAFIIPALLARLEAAENALEIYIENFHGYDDDSTKATKDWRRTKGAGR